jgi:hypothetical protein
MSALRFLPLFYDSIKEILANKGYPFKKDKGF